jgi:DNA mismatch repair protein MutS2
MTPSYLEKLDWSTLTSQLASFCQCEDARQFASALLPRLERPDIIKQWDEIEAIKNLLQQGFRAPIGELKNPSEIIKAAEIGQILDGFELSDILKLLVASKTVLGFSREFSERCAPLKKVRDELYPLANLFRSIEKSISPEGELFDSASPELLRIRQQKRSLRKKVEQTLERMLHGSDIETYLQDDFFTVRSDRYVVPIRLDGRGRIKGSIVDTSESGQTLFIELPEIAPFNQQLQELELGEKLEVIRIFKELSTHVAQEADCLRVNFRKLVRLDYLSACGDLANRQRSGMVQISSTPLIDLREARHPILETSAPHGAVANDIELKDQRVLIISGPNAGGKTVILKTVGLLQFMARAGLLLPASNQSSIYLFQDIYTEMGDSQSLANNLSTFSGHIAALQPILAGATENSLVLLDELAVGTEPQTGAAIAQAIIEDLQSRGAYTITTTHYDSLKTLAFQGGAIRNGSMEYSLEKLQPTYRLILDVPGQSYGLEVARHMGLSAKIIERAQGLRGHGANALDDAVHELMKARDETRRARIELDKERMAIAAQRAQWEEDSQVLEAARKKAAMNLKERYESELATLRHNIDEATREFREISKKAKVAGSNEHHDQGLSRKHTALDGIKDFQKRLGELDESYGGKSTESGQACQFSKLKTGDRVFVVPLKKEASIFKLGQNEADPIEVEIGMIKLRVALQDLQTVDQGRKHETNLSSNGQKISPITLRELNDSDLNLVLQTPTNTLDVRGCDLESAITKTWSFVDSALLRGESALIVVHGHGTDKLKTGIRLALNKDCPYDIAFRPGNDVEGGDGTTVVYLR